MEKMTKERVRSMTQEEFDRIPEWSSDIGREERVIDGKRVWIPVLAADPGAQWYEEDEIPGCVDPNGRYWRFVKVDGTLYKQRRSTPSWAAWKRMRGDF